jgi:hypothetical protein
MSSGLPESSCRLKQRERLQYMSLFAIQRTVKGPPLLGDSRIIRFHYGKLCALAIQETPLILLGPFSLFLPVPNRKGLCMESAQTFTAQPTTISARYTFFNMVA